MASTMNEFKSSAELNAVAAVAAGPKNQAMNKLILDHPLYPLLQMVFQKCELATSSPRDASQPDAVCSPAAFNEDIKSFINEARTHNIALTTGVHDVDRFMLKSIEVLRIHLLELDKVHQLCDNFCHRYIDCLKGKLPIDLVNEDGSSRDTNSTSRNGSNQQDGSSSNTNANNNTNNQTSNSNNTSSNSNTGNNSSSAQNGQSNGDQSSHHHHHQNNTTSHQHHHIHGQEVASAPAANGYQLAYHAYGGPYGAAAADYNMNQYGAHHAAYAGCQYPGMGSTGGHDGHHPAAGGHSAAATMTAAAAGSLAPNAKRDSHYAEHRELTASSGSSSASSIKMDPGANGHNGAHSARDDARSPAGSTGSGDGTECEDDDNRGRRQQKKRGIFPKAATNIMRAWLFQHLNHPYPSEDQKKQLAEETGLTILQVNNWFINARRRIVQPMIDQSNRTSGSIMAGPAYSPDAGMGYMLDGGQSFRSLSGADSSVMGPLASHAAMTSAMGAYTAASAQHLSQYGRSQQQHAAMLGLSTPTTGPHMMGAHPNLPPHEYY